MPAIKKYFFLTILVSVTASCFAFQNDSLSTLSKPTDSASHKKNIFVRLQDDFIVQAKAPFSMSGTEAMWFGAGAGITAGFLIAQQDQPVDNYINRLRTNNPWLVSSSDAITELGGTYGIAGAIAFGGYSLIANDAKAQETSILLGEALITSGAWTRLGKIVFGRERPSASYTVSHRSGGKWHGLIPQFKKNNLSVASFDGFPSGHTATAFAIATVFAKQYANVPAVPYIAYATASAVGISRIVNHTHWISDVFVGAALGYLCASEVVDHSPLRETETSAGVAKKISPHFYASMMNDIATFGMIVPF